MGKGAFFRFVSKIPLPPASVPLGAFVTIPKNPAQGNFDPAERLKSKPKPDKRDAKILNPSEIIDKAYGTSLEGVLSSFASVFFNVDGSSVRKLEASCMTHYYVFDVDGWLDQVCAEKETQFWLERQEKHKRRIYLITEYCTLDNTSSSSETRIEVSAGGSAQAVLAVAAGVPAPTPLDPSVNATGYISNSHKATHEIPGEKVFWIGYQEVKVSRDQAETDYTLSGNTKWVSRYSPRAASIKKKEVVTAELVEAGIPDDCEVLQVDDASYFFESVPG